MGRVAMKEWILACLAASTTSSMVAFRVLSPYLMFSARVLSNKTGSWETMPMRDRTQGTLRDSMLWSSTVWNYQNHLNLMLYLLVADAEQFCIFTVHENIVRLKWNQKNVSKTLQMSRETLLLQGCCTLRWDEDNNGTNVVIWLLMTSFVDFSLKRNENCFDWDKMKSRRVLGKQKRNILCENKNCD